MIIIAIYTREINTESYICPVKPEIRQQFTPYHSREAKILGVSDISERFSASWRKDKAGVCLSVSEFA